MLMPYVRHYNSNSDAFLKNMEMPFRIKFSFRQLFEYWEKLAASEEREQAAWAQSVLKRLEKKPVLREPFDDINLIEEHAEELKLLFSPIFPEMTTTNEIKAVCMPFFPFFFNVSKRLGNIMDAAGEDLQVQMRIEDPDLIYIMACVFILNFKFQAGFDYARKLYFDIPDTRTGLMRHYIIFFNADFSHFKINEGFTPPTPEDIQKLKENFEDIALWKKTIPPNSLDYEGFSLASLFDVTKEEAISRLKDDLLKKDALDSPEILELIRQNLCSFLNIQGLKLGFTTYDGSRDLLKSIGDGIDKSISIDNCYEKPANEAFCTYSHPHIFEQKKTLVITTVDKKYADLSPIMGKLSSLHLGSYIAVPLIYDGNLIGVLELGSEKVGELTSVVANLLKEVTPLFTTAMKRSQDELETRLEAVVQEQFTAIHPTVSWKFFEIAEKYLRENGEENSTELEDIVFPDVYPLYGQSDIKGSSTERNLAIQADTIEQLTLAKKVLEKALKKYPLPIYKQLKFRIDQSISKFKKELNAGDEITVLEFLKKDIYPAFHHIETLSEEMATVVQNYSRRLDKDLGVVYNRRKDYEESVQIINNKIGHYLEQAQIAAQKMFPHYFEKYKTDGVEHDLYIGASMVNNKEFDPLYLQNLRLWQLMVICEVENLMHKIKPRLKVPLDIASLVLVHSSPMTIKFSMEEKQFDVEGSYNIRYEILKKRIDKAYIKGTSERLTQPGKIAIVYSQDREAQEYAKYLEYLQSIHYIGPNIEWLELNDMQGVTGLRALRVEVTYQSEIVKQNSKLAVSVGH